MKIGSLVKCENDFQKRPGYPDEITPNDGEIYTVRSFYRYDRQSFIRLYEIKNKKMSYSGVVCECGFEASAFCEIQLPMDVSEIFADQLSIRKPEQLKKSDPKPERSGPTVDKMLN